MKQAVLLILASIMLVLGACSSGGNVAEENSDEHATESHAHVPIAGSTDAWDLHFIDGMIVHHQGAIDMAQQVLVEAEHEELRTFAQAIIEAQTAEVAQMQEWRAAWFADQPQSNIASHDMGDMSIAEDASLPFDQRFLQAMISHHEGALSMAADADTQSGHEEIRTLATAIQQAQTAEIEQMRAWLQEWYGVDQ